MKDEILAKRLIHLHNNGMTWDEIALLDDYKGIPVGTIWGIAHGRIIRDPIQRDFLNLDQDKNCGQCWRFNKYIGLARKLRRKPTRLYQMNKASLKIAFENREIIQDGNSRNSK